MLPFLDAESKVADGNHFSQFACGIYRGKSIYGKGTFSALELTLARRTMTRFHHFAMRPCRCSEAPPSSLEPKQGLVMLSHGHHCVLPSASDTVKSLRWYFFAKGAKPDANSRQGWTALHCALRGELV